MEGNKEVVITFKATENYKEGLKQKAESVGMNLSTYIRCALEENQVVVLAESDKIAFEFFRLNEYLGQNIETSPDYEKLRKGVVKICQLLDSLLAKIN